MLQSSGKKTFKVLHITDLHYDPNYVSGRQKNCHRPVCCQNDQPEGTTSDDRCGYWGEYGADTPLQTVVEALENSRQHVSRNRIYCDSRSMVGKKFIEN